MAEPVRPARQDASADGGTEQEPEVVAHMVTPLRLQELGVRGPFEENGVLMGSEVSAFSCK